MLICVYIKFLVYNPLQCRFVTNLIYLAVYVAFNIGSRNCLGRDNWLGSIALTTRFWPKRFHRWKRLHISDPFRWLPSRCGIVSCVRTIILSLFQAVLALSYLCSTDAGGFWENLIFFDQTDFTVGNVYIFLIVLDDFPWMRHCFPCAHAPSFCPSFRLY